MSIASRLHEWGYRPPGLRSKINGQIDGAPSAVETTMNRLRLR
jgi:hypothetical protein